jgi:hypothetical protein
LSKYCDKRSESNPISPADQISLNKLNERLGIPSQGAIPKVPYVTQAKQTSAGLPTPGKGKGTVPPSQRDPKRVWTKKEGTQQLEKQDGKCAQPKNVNETQGHHNKRHADGGQTESDNHSELCKE